VDTNVHSRSFFVHRDLITSRSKFFAKAFRSYSGTDNGAIKWREGEDGIIKMPEDSQDVFTQYLQLIYYGRVPVGKTLKGDTKGLSAKDLDKALDDLSDQEYVALSKLYVFCEKVEDLHSKAIIITAFVETARTLRENNTVYYPNPGPIKIVYDGSMNRDPLRQFLVNCYVLRADERWFEGSAIDDYNPQFLFDALVEMAKQRDKIGDKARIQTAEQYCKKLLEAEE